MTFSVHHGGVVMSSQITHRHIIIHPLAHILDICALIFSSCALFTVFSNRIMYTASNPSTGDNHQSTEGRSERTQGQGKMAA